MHWKIEEMPYKPIDGQCDWHAWLKSPDGISVLVQISFNATQERANEIVAELIGIKAP